MPKNETEDKRLELIESLKSVCQPSGYSVEARGQVYRILKDKKLIFAGSFGEVCLWIQDRLSKSSRKKKSADIELELSDESFEGVVRYAEKLGLQLEMYSGIYRVKRESRLLFSDSYLSEIRRFLIRYGYRTSQTVNKSKVG